MLFLAVFCGFLAENQREQLVEKKRAKEYARSIGSASFSHRSSQQQQEKD